MKHQNLWVACAAIGASLAILGGAASVALAQHAPITTVIGERSDEEQRRALVTYRDLDLTQARAVTRLNHRVGLAAKAVCQPDERIVGDPAYSDCMRGAWLGARPQIALAVGRAQQIAATGSSSIPLVGIAVVGRR